MKDAPSKETPIPSTPKDIQDKKFGIPHDKFIVPRELVWRVAQFIAHYEAAKQEPILIVGASGVGKSLFLHLFEKLYREEHGEKSPIITVNCSHFAGDLARSELFGYTRGAFTGAIRDRTGWIEKANGGVLILEEIGDLPLETQTKLLTFIETKEYSKVGSSEIKKANLQIVGATNREEKLREDFRYRFFPFYIPPLYKRRRDVLYYLAAKFPTLIESLTTWEVLTLLAYNWPGNVREVERVGRLLQRKKLLPEYMPIKVAVINDFGRLLSLDEMETSLKAKQAVLLYNSLEENGIDVNRLESLLSHYRVGLFPESPTLAFPDLLEHKLDPVRSYYKRFGLKSFIWFRPFDQAYDGYSLYCSLFFQDETANKNVLDVAEGTSIEFPSGRDGFATNSLQENELKESIFGYLSGIKLPKWRVVPTERQGRAKFLSSLAKDYPSNRFLTSLLKGHSPQEKDQGKDLDIWSMTQDDLLKTYYEGLLERTGGNKTEAAKLAGVEYKTFYSRLQKYNPTPKQIPQNPTIK